MSGMVGEWSFLEGDTALARTAYIRSTVCMYVCMYGADSYPSTIRRECAVHMYAVHADRLIPRMHAKQADGRAT